MPELTNVQLAHRADALQTSIDNLQKLIDKTKAMIAEIPVDKIAAGKAEIAAKLAKLKTK